jgi:hypothetical protein
MSISPCHLSRFPPEFQLACVCCRPSPTAADQAEMRRLLRIVDVQTFVDLVVTRHRIGPLVHAALCGLPRQDLPAGLMEPLAEDARHNAVKALRARTHIMLARWFAEAGIDWMPFKGTTVALRYYQDASTRQVNDLDIWVPTDRIPQARAILSKHGFRVLDADIHGDLAARGKQHSAYIEAYFHEEQHYSSEFGLLELHWRLADNPFQFRLEPEQILANADMIRLGNASVLVMRDIDLLLYLCDHGARHGWSRLKWLADLPRVVSDRAWDWSRVLGRAHEAGSYQTLIIGLALCEDLFAWRPPPAVLGAIAMSRRLPVALRVIRQSWNAPAATKLIPFPQVVRLIQRELALSLLLTDNFLSVVYQLRRYLLSPNDLQVIKLPDRWFGLYYLMRPVLTLVRRASALRRR